MKREAVMLRDLLDMVRMTTRLFDLCIEQANVQKALERSPRHPALIGRLKALREEASLIKCSMPEPVTS